MPALKKTDRRKRLQGTARRDRRPKQDLSARLSRLPLAPKSLNERAQAAWVRVGAAAIGIGTLTGADLAALELLAITLGSESEARSTLEDEGMSVTTASGGSKPHPCVRIAENARAQAQRLLSEFGLTPRSRQSVDTVPLPTRENDFGSFDRYLASDPDFRK